MPAPETSGRGVCVPDRAGSHWNCVMNNHLLALGDFSKDALRALIDRGLALKADRKRGVRHQQLAGVPSACCLKSPRPVPGFPSRPRCTVWAVR